MFILFILIPCTVSFVLNTPEDEPLHLHTIEHVSHQDLRHIPLIGLDNLTWGFRGELNIRHEDSMMDLVEPHAHAKFIPTDTKKPRPF